jgi:hypothetical protein
VVLCHRSWRGVIACFRDLLEGPVSLGSVHALGRPAVSLAQHINPAQALGRGRAGSHDELGRPAGGAGLALESTSCDRLAAVAHRDAEPGGIHLLDLAAQGLRPEATVADGGRGWRAGQALAGPGVPCHGDVFHGLQELTRLTAPWERRA